jgi:threonine synthase
MWKDNAPYEPVRDPETIATAIKIGDPVSWEKSARGLKWCDGVVEQVSEQEIMDAKAMVDKAGIGAEPASCCSVAGARKLVESGVIHPDAKVVGILTGNILKDPDAVVGYHKDALRDRSIEGRFANKPLAIEPNLEDVRRILLPILERRG